MSVLIKGMEMPTSCDGSCPLYDGEFLRCNITYTEPWLGHEGEPIEDPIPIPSDCPLVPVPPQCKDCEFYIKHDKRCAVWNHGVFKDDYCSRGLKKEVEE